MSVNRETPNWRTSAGRIVERLFPWLIFAAFMLWAVGGRDLTKTLPHYGDTAETVFGVAWLDETLMQGRSPLVYPLNYFPEGWRVASHVTGMPFHVLLWPFYRLGGAAFAANLAILLSCLLAFAGTYLLSRLYFDSWISIVPALAYTFWGLRWNQAMDGRLNVLASSTLLPWILLAIERALQSNRHKWRWLIMAGGAWALAFLIAQYFVFIGGIMVVVWILLSPSGQPRSWRQKFVELGIVMGTFLLLSLPWLLLSLREAAIADPPFYTFPEVNLGGASLNSLPIPFLYHPWLGSLARSIYKGVTWEQSIANLGFLAPIMALVGAFLARKQRSWRPVLAMTAVFLLLCLGLTLHWDGEPVRVAGLRPLNLLLWRLGHTLKPDFFVGAQPPEWNMDTIPLPAMVLAVFVPFFERGRALARYALPAGLGIFLLASLVLSRVRFRWLQVFLGVLLVFEIVPPRLETVPFPSPTHPAFEWLKQQPMDGLGILDAYSGNPSTLVMGIGGEALLATGYHGKPTAAGSAGVIPRHTVFLENWLASHQHTFWQPDFAQIMRDYKIKYVLMQMRSADEEVLWQEAQVADTVRAVDCFQPPDGPSAWPWSICVVEIPPAPSPDFNVLWGDGWSGREDWGVWAEGTESQAQWIATARAPQRLSVAAFPQCLPDRFQRIEVEANGTVIATHQWQDCEPWSTTVDIPVELVHVGANDLVVRAAYAAQPSEGDDPRQLSAGFTKLLVEPYAK